MNYELAISDFDGTLLDSNGRISDKTISVIKEYTARGGIFAVSTGRMTTSIIRELARFGLTNIIGKYVAGFNGGVIAETVTGNWVEESSIHAVKAIVLLEELIKRGMYIQLYVGDHYYISDYNDFTAEYSSYCNVMPIVVPSLIGLLKEKHWKVAKIIAFDKVTSYEAVESLSKKFDKDYLFTASNENFFEVADNSVGKDKGLLALARLYGIDPTKTVAFGDGRNDIGMLLEAGLGIAVSNADSEVVKAAKITTSSNDEDGVAEILLKIMEGKL